MWKSNSSETNIFKWKANYVNLYSRIVFQTESRKSSKTVKEGREVKGEWKYKDCMECSHVNCKWTPQTPNPPAAKLCFFTLTRPQNTKSRNVTLRSLQSMKINISFSQIVLEKCSSLITCFTPTTAIANLHAFQRDILFKKQCKVD